MKQLEMLYEGKAKQVFRTDDPDTSRKLRSRTRAC